MSNEIVQTLIQRRILYRRTRADARTFFLNKNNFLPCDNEHE